MSTGSNPATTNNTAGNAARCHSPSDVISKIRTASVSQPKGRIIKVIGISFNTSITTNSNPVVSGNAPLRGKKGMRYEGGVRVPMIAAWAKAAPGNPFQAALPIAGGTHQDDLVHVTDLFPTILGEAGVSFTHTIDGHDLRPYFTATPGYHRPQSLVTHFPHGHNNDHFTIYHEGPWKLIFNYADESCELYNLAADLGEQNNLAASETARLMAMTRGMARELNAMGAQFSQNLNTSAPQPPRTPPRQRQTPA